MKKVRILKGRKYQEKTNVYLDMDGVIADFNNEPDALERFATEEGFFRDLKVMNKWAVNQLLAMEDINGVKTAVKCELVEVSVCDIPSNENALQLYFNDKPVSDWPTYMQLALNEGTSRTILKPVTEVLGVAWPQK